MLGVDDRTGSLEPGKMADVVLWRRHPLSVYARAARVWADGVLTFDELSGPAVPSDFELGPELSSSARLVAKTAEVPPAVATRCEGDCAKPVPVEASACTAITSALVVSGGKAEPATVLVQNGKVAQVGASVSVPAGCRTIDGRGRVLTAGLFDAFTSLGLVEVAGEEMSSDTGPRGDAAKQPIHAALQAADSVNPASATLAVARAGGITTALAVPSGGLIPGQSAWLTTDGAIRRATTALHVNLGIAGRDAVSSSRSAVLERLRELLDDAREYGKRKAQFEANQMRDLSASRLDLEALQPVLAGKLPVVVSADRVTDLRASLQLAAQFGLKLVLAGGERGVARSPTSSRGRRCR